MDSKKYGLATRLLVTCLGRIGNEKAKIHTWTINPRITVSDSISFDKTMYQKFELNLTSILAVYQAGIRYISMQRFFAFFGVDSCSVCQYLQCEKLLEVL